jgi:hypothetical protein
MRKNSVGDVSVPKSRWRSANAFFLRSDAHAAILRSASVLRKSHFRHTIPIFDSDTRGIAPSLSRRLHQIARQNPAIAWQNEHA